MARIAVDSLKNGIGCLNVFSSEAFAEIKKAEDKTDHYEDVIGNYLVKLSALKLNNSDSSAAAKLLKIIGDSERISDHAVNLAGSAEEMYNKKLEFSEEGKKEIDLLTDATSEILDLTYSAFVNNDLDSAVSVEPLEQIIDDLKEKLRSNHTVRLQKGLCSIELGFVWADILTNLERISEHCSNIAGCVLETTDETLELHRSVRAMKINNSVYATKYESYAEKYLN